MQCRQLLSPESSQEDDGDTMTAQLRAALRQGCPPAAPAASPASASDLGDGLSSDDSEDVQVRNAGLQWGVLS